MGKRLVGLLMVIGLGGMLMPGAASADTFVTPFVGATFGGDAPSSEPAYGLAVGGMAFGIFGLEGEFGYMPNFFNQGTLVTSSHVMTLMANVLAGAPVGPIRPYATIGAGMIRQQRDLSVPGLLSNVSSSDFGFNAGGGARFILTNHVGFRGDVRYLKVQKSGGLGFWRAYGGLTLSF